MKPNTARTLIKISLGRRGRQWGFLFGICSGLVAGLVLIALMQIYFCKRQHPKADWVTCLRPIITPKEIR